MTQAEIAERIEALEGADVSYEVWEDDLLVASSTCPKDALHYHAVYSQDAAVTLKKAITVRTRWEPSQEAHNG
ncbi:hypothetical protein [Pelagerythrobacter marinus]|jgi:hypothetical protein|uniref:hypothetical protein n=1 Tax=Pelagerythrobacter marinus TaxID=538382 RepID=UPI002AC97A6C|nr:hypothetical protein [Pelagerythrobacter marinus]WPZ05528.1 hypothetical protein T8T98_08790 [Pelagerythrobacter marinus]